MKNSIKLMIRLITKGCSQSSERRSSELNLTFYRNFNFHPFYTSAFRVHVSPYTKDILDELGGYKLEFRGEVELKVSGVLIFYFVEFKRASRFSLVVGKFCVGETSRHRVSSSVVSNQISCSVFILLLMNSN